MISSEVTNKRVYWYGGWAGSQQEPFMGPIGKQPFDNTFPFKKYLISTDAPVLENTRDFVVRPAPPNLVANSKIAIQKGNIYDLSRIERSRNRPIMVSKLSNGSYRIITSNKDLTLTESQLSEYRVPLLINGKEMKDLDLKSPASINANSLTVRVTYNSFGQPKGTDDIDEGQIHLLIQRQRDVVENVRDPNYYSRILGAELISSLQLREKRVIDFAGKLIPDHPYLKYKDRILFLEGRSAFGYVGVGSMRYLFDNVVATDLDNYSPFFQEQYRESLNATRTQVYTALPNGSINETSFHDHIFIRI